MVGAFARGYGAQGDEMMSKSKIANQKSKIP
jgi:hypothetical protein